MAKKNKKNVVQDDSTLPNDDRMVALELFGKVEEALPGTLFRINTEHGHNVLCTLSGKMRMNHIRILPGDQVTIEVSPYDLSRGRIMWRQKS